MGMFDPMGVRLAWGQSPVRKRGGEDMRLLGKRLFSVL